MPELLPTGEGGGGDDDPDISDVSVVFQLARSRAPQIKWIFLTDDFFFHFLHCRLTKIKWICSRYGIAVVG